MSRIPRQFGGLNRLIATPTAIPPRGNLFSTIACRHSSIFVSPAQHPLCSLNSRNRSITATTTTTTSFASPHRNYVTFAKKGTKNPPPQQAQDPLPPPPPSPIPEPAQSVQPERQEPGAYEPPLEPKRKPDAAAPPSSTKPGPQQRTPLYDIHISKNAKMVPFAGYTMPLLYADQSHIESHLWTRTNASLFDVSHMVQHSIKGSGALAFLETITPSDLVNLGNMRGTLSAFMEEETGGMVDDCIITKQESSREFYVVTNAGCAEKDLAYLKHYREKFLLDAYGSGILEEGEEKEKERNERLEHVVLEGYGLVALQGPQAEDVLGDYLKQNVKEIVTVGAKEVIKHGKINLEEVSFGDAFKVKVPASPSSTGKETPLVVLHVARCGYTGEDGFEISIPPGEDGKAPKHVTKEILKIGTPERVRMAGLAARDSLRLEAGLCLYGHDINEEVTPVQAGLKWIIAIRRRKGNFPGSKVILYQLKKEKDKELARDPGKLGGTGYRYRVGIMMDEGQGIVREGTPIMVPSENKWEIGVVTSGAPAPSLGMRAVAMGYVDDGWDNVGTELGFLVRGRMKTGKVVKMPFVPTRYYRGKSKGDKEGGKEKVKGAKS